MARVYLIAGEASGDILGGRLIAALRDRRPEIDVGGIGGGRMAGQGLRSLFPMDELAVMGFLEVLPRLRLLRRRLAETVADVAARRPDVVVTIDSPGFALRVLRAVAPLGVRRVHYVAPQVWAWREGRVRRYPGLWDRLLCLLPFEPAFFAKHGLQATFVGHPVLESGADRGDGAAFRRRHGIAETARVVTVMPGSRRGEVARLLPIIGAALRYFPVIPAKPGTQARNPREHGGSLGSRFRGNDEAGGDGELVAVMPVQPGMVKDRTRSWPIAPIIVEDEGEKHDAFAASSAALTKSGTSTLELALAGVPMLVAYRVNPVSAAIARRLVTVRHAALVNLLAPRENGAPLVPEFLQRDCTPERLAGALAALLDDPAQAAAQRAGFAAVLDSLRPAGGLKPSEAAAEAVLSLLEQP